MHLRIMLASQVPLFYYGLAQPKAIRRTNVIGINAHNKKGDPMPNRHRVALVLVFLPDLDALATLFKHKHCSCSFESSALSHIRQYAIVCVVQTRQARLWRL